MRRWSFAAIVAAFAVVGAVGGAHAVELTNSGSAVANSINGYIDSDRSRNTVNSMAGEGYANVLGTTISGQREFRRALPSVYSYSQTAHYQDRADASVSGEAYANIESSAIAAGCPTTMCAPGNRWVMWDVPFYLREVQKETDGALGYTNKVAGFATGISRMIGDRSAIGYAIGYDARTLARKDGYHFRNKADTLHMALFGGTNLGNFFIDGYAGWSRSWNRMEREVADGTARLGLLKDNYRDDVFSVGAKVSYVWILQNDMRITPSVGLDFSHVRMEGINERPHAATLDALALRSGRSTYNNLSIPVTVSINKTYSSSFMTFRGAPSLWTPEIRGGYTAVVGDKRPEVDFSATEGVNSINFKTTGAKFTGSYGTVGAGLKLKLADKYIFAVDYDFTAGDKYRNHSITGMYGVSF